MIEQNATKNGARAEISCVADKRPALADGAANRCQPIRSETYSALSAAGSRRSPPLSQCNIFAAISNIVESFLC